MRALSTAAGTGSNSSDPRRSNPEQKAKQYHLSCEHLEDLTEVVIAGYNATPHDDLNGDTPLECLERWALHPETLIRYLPLEKHSATCVLPLRVECNVTGSLKNARAPGIHWHGVRYTSEALKKSFWLVSKTLTIWVDTDDLRTVRAFLPDASEFGILNATGAWGWVPHDLRMRTLLQSLRRRKKIYFADSEDWRPVYAQFCRSVMSKDKRMATEYARALEKGFVADQSDPREAPVVRKRPLAPAVSTQPSPKDYVREIGFYQNEIL